jgi:ribosome-associated protein
MGTQDPLQTLNLIAQTISQKKGFNILALDVRNVSTMTDFFLIAEGNVDRHVVGLSKTVMETLKAEGLSPIYVEGLQVGDWVVLDYMEIVVHIFMPGLRDKYRLEQIWQEGKIIDLALEEHTPAVGNI